MNHFKFEDLPLEIFELLSTYLEYHEIAKLEQTSKRILSTIQELNLWRRIAIRLIQTYDDPAVSDALHYIRENAETCPKVCKVMIGITVHTMEIVNDLQKSITGYISMCEEKKLIRRDAEILDEDDILQYHEFVVELMTLEFQAELRRDSLNNILICYDRALNIITGYEEDSEICVDINMDKVLYLDVTRYIYDYKRQTSVFKL